MYTLVSDLTGMMPRLVKIFSGYLIGFVMHWIKWAATRENLSSGFVKKCDSNQPAQLQGLARIVKFCLYQV